MILRSIDLKLADRLKDQDFRREWFRAELEDVVPEMFRDLREERNLTQSELATKAGMKQSAISRFERDRGAKWNFETLLKLAEALDAQLLISIIKAEYVIARFEREESGTMGNNKASVLDATSESEFNKNKLTSILATKDVKPIKKEKDSILGENKWN